MTTFDRRDALRLIALPLAGFALAGRPGMLLAREEAATDRRWWKEAVIYQIYPRSFMDSDGDGVGDPPGIVSKLDHIAALGIDVVWLCPHYPSPNVDNGYDVSDYRAVSPLVGTMADFDALVAGLKARGIRLIVDLVANHTSDRHPWFERSRSARDAPDRNYYIWRDGKDGGPPNNYPSLFGGPAWTREEATGQYYLHLFAPQQPDDSWAVLEWECCLKHPEDGAREGAGFIASHIIRVTDRAFDDFAGAAPDESLNRRMLGF